MQAAEIIADGDLVPIVPYIVMDNGAEPGLVGRRCATCNAIALGDSVSVCACCGARDGMMPVALANTGRLYVWTMVYRSLPGVKTPFLFAIVDLDGGGVVKGNLVAAQSEIRFDMPVRIVFERSTRVDAKGRSYLTYHFAKA